MVNTRPINVFEAIQRYGHDEDFAPRLPGTPTDTVPGTQARVEVYAARALAGEPIFIPGDRTLEGVRGTVWARPDPAPVNPNVRNSGSQRRRMALRTAKIAAAKKDLGAA
mgnify:CR=1 FL=1